MRKPILPKDYLEPRNTYGIAGVLAVVLPVVLTIACIPYLFEGRHWGWLALSAPILGMQAHKLTIVMHDCCHSTLFVSKRLNQLVGTIGGALLGSSFSQYQASHWQHHRRCGHGGDPTEEEYLGLDGLPVRMLVWHLIKPLFGVTYLRSVAHKESLDPVRPDVPGGGISWRGHEVCMTVVLQILIALTVSRGGSFLGLVLIYPISGVTFGIFFSRLRGFCEHTPMRSVPAGECFTRTHLTHPVEKFIFYNLNMNYHFEHHMYPLVASCYLPEVNSLLVNSGLLDDDSLSKSMISTVYRRLCAAS